MEFIGFVLGFVGFFSFLICLIGFVVVLILKKSKKLFAIGMALSFVAFAVGVTLFGEANPDDSEPQQVNDDRKGSKTPQDSKDEPSSNEEQDSESKDDESKSTSVLDINSSLDTTGYLNFDADVLFEYGNYLGGQNVVTVITVSSAGYDTIRARTDNNDGFFYSVTCQFDDEEVVKSVNEGDVLTIAGTLEERNPLVDKLSFLETPTAAMVNCSIIGKGEIAQELKAGADEQRKIGQDAKDAYEAQIAAAKKAERDDYISQCETVKYSDVERNPDNYDGKKIKISGKVVQVSEGWFDTVTMRIDCGGNMWYVTYSREEGESRILEDDKITCYGECNGVTSYKTVIGSQVTIPSMRMEYYD